MTQTILTTAATNDLYLDPSGNLALGTGVAAVQQACQNVSRASLGEEVLSINNGIPFFQVVFVGVPNIQIFEAYLRSALLTVPSVVEIQNLTTAIAGGTLSYTVTVETQYGLEFTFTQEIPIP
jgi:hypothetical protein